MGILNDVAEKIVDVIQADPFFVSNAFVSINSVDFNVENMVLTELSKVGLVANVNIPEIYGETASYIGQGHRDLTLGGTIDIFEHPTLNTHRPDVTGHEIAQQIVATLDATDTQTDLNLPGLHCLSLKNTSHLVHTDNPNSMNIVRWTIVWTATKCKVFSVVDFPRMTESGDIRITEDGNVLVLEF